MIAIASKKQESVSFCAPVKALSITECNSLVAELHLGPQRILWGEKCTSSMMDLRSYVNLSAQWRPWRKDLSYFSRKRFTHRSHQKSRNKQHVLTFFFFTIAGLASNSYKFLSGFWRNVFHFLLTNQFTRVLNLKFQSVKLLLITIWKALQRGTAQRLCSPSLWVQPGQSGCFFIFLLTGHQYSSIKSTHLPFILPRLTSLLDRTADGCYSP